MARIRNVVLRQEGAVVVIILGSALRGSRNRRRWTGGSIQVDLVISGNGPLGGVAGGISKVRCSPMLLKMSKPPRMFSLDCSRRQLLRLVAALANVLAYRTSQATYS